MLKNKVAIVTGGSRGIGKAIALELAREGADIAVIYNGNKKSAEEVCQEISKLGQKALASQCDVSDFDKVGETITEIKNTLGIPEILVNNAGITKDGLIFMLKEDDFDAVISTNLKGTFNMIKHVSKLMMKNKKGSIVNISSVSGMMGNPGQANYASAKAGVIGLTKTIAKELAPKGIRCNAIAPGFVETDMTEKLSEEIKCGVEKSVPMRRMAKPEDIAYATGFLASSKAEYITGEIIKVDGGLYI